MIKDLQNKWKLSYGVINLEQQEAKHNYSFKHKSWLHGNNTYNERNKLALNTSYSLGRNFSKTQNCLSW
jgi:hypothetical protein